MRDHLVSPITIPRWLLTALYLGFVLLGSVVMWASAPSIELVASSDFAVTVWAAVLALVGLVAAVTSLRIRWERWEKYAASAVAGLFLVYAFAPTALVLQGDADRASLSVVALLLSAVPSVRAFGLWFDKGKRSG